MVTGASPRGDGVFVVAEMGSNHDGDLAQALRLVSVGAEAGVDAVKAQAIPPFQRDWLEPLFDACEVHGVEFMITPFDVKAVRILDPYVRRWKIASAEITRDDLLTAALRTGKPMILSTGMATTDEIRYALQFCGSHRPVGVLQPTLLHCVSAYPAPYELMNLRAMNHLVWGNYTPGISDHTLGWHVALAAVALGARVVEKHFTLDRALSGPDHHYALEPGELMTMVSQIRDVEKALGKRSREPYPQEVLEARGRNLVWT